MSDLHQLHDKVCLDLILLVVDLYGLSQLFFLQLANLQSFSLQKRQLHW
jgi:hypothetical protein